MKANMGSADRVARLILAVVMGVLYFQGIVGGTLGVILVVAAVVFALTSLISFCPLYSIFGICTKKKENK
ncbi:MAG: DUF2892 domain-containing protein [Cyclobacteriaceae bacterium]|nr:DUF2892 domain-containing protein [Cyclobacteriaceae bacterium]